MIVIKDYLFVIFVNRNASSDYSCWINIGYLLSFLNTSEVVKGSARFFDNCSEGVEKAVTEVGRLHPDFIRSFYEKSKRFIL